MKRHKKSSEHPQRKINARVTEKVATRETKGDAEKTWRV